LEENGKAMNTLTTPNIVEHREVRIAPAAEASGGANPQAWEEIEDGRYQPRRVRGSCIGRELG